MNRGTVLVTAGAIAALLGLGHDVLAQAVQPCPNPDNCVQVGVVNVGASSGKPGDTLTVGVTFKQAPATGDPGGPDKVAAVAMTLLEVGGGTPIPLKLANCNFTCLGGDNPGGTCTTDTDCPNGQCLVGAVKPGDLLSGFKAVVENASCANGRSHCLCPDAGQTQDNFINLVVYGPNPLPATGPVDIPTLPTGQLLTIDLTIDSAAVPGTVITVHPINQAADSAHPEFTALLSVGDKTAVDQTCSPLATTGTAPCAAAGSVSLVSTNDASITVTTNGCIGDKDTSGDISAGEVVFTILAFAQDDVSQNPAADGNMNGSVEANEVVQVIANFAQDACNAFQP